MEPLKEIKVKVKKRPDWVPTLKQIGIGEYAVLPVTAEELNALRVNATVLNKAKEANFSTRVVKNTVIVENRVNKGGVL